MINFFDAKFDSETVYFKECKEENQSKIDSMKRTYYPFASSLTKSDPLLSLKFNTV